jgi:hypothetical protein
VGKKWAKPTLYQYPYFDTKLRMFLKKNDMIRLLNKARVVGLTDFKSPASTIPPPGRSDLGDCQAHEREGQCFGGSGGVLIRQV